MVIRKIEQGAMENSAEQDHRIMTIVAAARQQPPGEREKYVRLLCLEDAELLREVSDALDWEGRMGTFLLDPAMPTPEPEIGPYRLLQKIGEGGMAEVWLAEQMTPIRREVALKLIRPGMDSKVMIARFESERQALALMDHPAIAKVFDAGSTPQGQPYFVMEYVLGLPITEYCDKNRLTIRERLELFSQLCEGVQHAHQKAIIHRDLKPSNVLVVLQDGKPVPKIIDFGIAKAMGQRLTDKTMFTELGMLLGTPEYMSPEQADQADHVDTRTDVYSLGVILYKLLVGAPPFESKWVRGAGLEEFLRRIREDDPPRPSTIARKLGDASKEAARLRKTDPDTLTRQLEGDLDWIIIKAMEKNRARRYGSASDLAAEIGRYLHDEPVLARPPSIVYRTRKFVRRHRFGAGVAIGLVTLLLGFAISMGVETRRIVRERDRANREAEVSRRVTDFMTHLFEVSDPSESRGSTITARELLDKGAKQIDTELRGQPVVQGALMHTMGLVYKNLGLYSPADTLLQRASQLRRSVLGPEDAATLASANALAIVYRRQNRFGEAEKLQRETLDLLRRKFGPDRAESIEALNNLARVLVDERRSSDAEPLLREALDRARRALGTDHRVTTQSVTNLGMVLSELGHGDQAEELFREALASNRRMLGPEHPETVLSMEHLAQCLGMYEGKYEDSYKLLHEVLDIQTRLLGPEHPDVITTMGSVGRVQMLQHRYEEADQTFQDALSRTNRASGSRYTYSGLVMILYNDACVKALKGNREDAFVTLEEAVSHGYQRLDDMASDEDLKSLRGDPRFQALLKKIKQNRVPN
jgi:eukaryotic-like serine/threonine-protein kinase